MTDSLKSVLDNAVQIDNLIKARPINSRLFKMLCNDTGSEYETLILHTEARWLLRGKVMTTVVQLRMKLPLFFFLKQKRH
jgi:hypothetical protein